MEKQPGLRETETGPTPHSPVNKPEKEIMESFQELNLPAFLTSSLQRMKFTKPMPVQAQAIPAALLGRDVVASAQTGTGKTAAFGIPLLAYLDAKQDRCALVLTPTRELAIQVSGVLRNLSGGNPAGISALLIGGDAMGPQLSALARKPRLIIGTPGRIIDHLKRGTLSLARVGILVLDEADRMLDMGFEPQLEEIRGKLSPDRQTLLFSATIPPDIKSMASRYLKDPVRIEVGSSTQPVSTIAQRVLYTLESAKDRELAAELNAREGSVLVFARTQRRVDRILTRLKDQGFKATRVHGGRSQSQRRQAMDHFREGRYRVLVATDLAARGLDIHHIAHVINYDLPRNPEDYIHRVGRTARAGAEGSSLCFLTGEDNALWERILKLMKVPRNTIQTQPSRAKDAPPAASASHPAAPSRPSVPRGDFRSQPRQQGREGRPGGFAGGNRGRPGAGPGRLENSDPNRRREEFRPHRRPAPFQDTRRENQGRPWDRFKPKRTFDPARSGNFNGPRPNPDRNRNRYDRAEIPGGHAPKPWQKDRIPKERHPDGRHQRRSDQHYRKFGEARPGAERQTFIYHGPEKGPNSPSGGGAPLDDRQPTKPFRENWERKPEGFFPRRPGFKGRPRQGGKPGGGFPRKSHPGSSHKPFFRQGQGHDRDGNKSH